MDSELPPLPEDLGDASNVFLLSPSLGGWTSEACMSLASSTPADETNLMAVSFTRQLEDWLDDWDKLVGEPRPAQMVYISIGNSMRVSPGQEGQVELDGGRVMIESVQGGGNLTRIGVTISKHLSEWQEDDRSVAFCFESITPMLHYMDPQQVYRFLHQLTGQIKAMDAIGHYHMDPNAHDEVEIPRFKTLFDAVVQPTDEGEWSVESRH